MEAELPDGRRLHVAVEEVIHPGFVKAGLCLFIIFVV